MSQTSVIRLENLSKSFGGVFSKKIEAVKNVSLDIQAGQVYGFLGPNGAGKTTTIRMILDLMRPTGGRSLIWGTPAREKPEILRRVGALVEGAAFYPYLTGRKNLEVIARTHGVYDSRRIDDLLAQMSLSERANQRYKGYSMGMKQRLGLAAALLHDPDLLILDEPTNGLDPAGIQEMRYFIRELVDKHGKSVFLSSHMLNEVEQICDRVAIISKGEIVHEGTVADVVEAATTGSAQSVLLRVSPVEQTQTLLGSDFKVNPVRQGNATLLRVEVDHERVPEVVRNLVEQGVDVYEIIREKRSLEDFFLSVTQGEAQTINVPQSDEMEVTHV